MCNWDTKSVCVCVTQQVFNGQELNINSPHGRWVMSHCWWCQGAVLCVRVCVCKTLSRRKCATQIWLYRAESTEINYRGQNRGRSINFWLTVSSLEIKTQLFSKKDFQAALTELITFSKPCWLTFILHLLFFSPFQSVDVELLLDHLSVFSLPSIFLSHSLISNYAHPPLFPTPPFFHFLFLASYISSCFSSPPTLALSRLSVMINIHFHLQHMPSAFARWHAQSQTHTLTFTHIQTAPWWITHSVLTLGTLSLTRETGKREKMCVCWTNRGNLLLHFVLCVSMCVCACVCLCVFVCQLG